MQQPRLHWDAETGWVLDVPKALDKGTLHRLVTGWCFKQQHIRWLGMPPGDKKEELGRALVLLRDGKVQQRVVGMRGDGRGDIVAYDGARLNRVPGRM